MADRPKAKAPGKGIATVEQLMKAPETLKRFERFAAKGLDPERLFAVAALAVNRTPDLLKARPVELMKALMHVTSLGLEINSPRGHAYLIPFKSGNEMTIQVIIGYKGLAELMYRSERISTLQADVATMREWKSGLFKYQMGLEPMLVHQYAEDRDEDTDTPGFAYAVVTMKDGTRRFEVMNWKAIERIRNSSSGYRYAKSLGTDSKAYKKSPWVSNPWEMAKKTVVRRMAKLLPLSADLASAVAADEGSEREDFDIGDIVELDPAAWKDMATEEGPSEPESGAEKPKGGKGRGKAPETTTPHDPETGEVRDDPAETNKTTDDIQRANDAETPEHSQRADDAETPSGAERAEQGEAPDPKQRAEPKQTPDTRERDDEAPPSDPKKWF